jgi:phosphoenolpyruvate carboxykinase (GTP)
LNLGAKLEQAGATLPRIYTTNWFRKGADGKFVWPGYGENMRVLKWMIDRLEGKATGKDNGFGVAPEYSEINWTGLDFSEAQFDSVSTLDRADWAQEIALHTELFTQLAYHLPSALETTKQALAARLAS